MTPDDLQQAVTRYQNARPAMRRPMLDSATAIALSLSDDRDELVRLLDKRWRWLDERSTIDLAAWTVEKHHPQFDEREDALLAILAQYEAIEDALRHAASVLYGGQAA